MKKFVFSCVLVVGIMLSFYSHAYATPVQWAGNGHWYEVFSVPPESSINWLDAKQLAIDKGGYLATITSEAENDFVFSLVVGTSEFWWNSGPSYSGGVALGGYQTPGSTEPAGGWRWVTDDEPFDYTNWCSGQPDDAGGTQENYLAFYDFDKCWNDARNDSQIGYVVEYIPEPATLLLLSFAGMSLLRKRSV